MNKEWNVDRGVILLAGTFILASVLLAHFHNLNWLWFTGFVAVNMIQSTVTGFCPAAIIMQKLGLKSGCVYGKASK